MTHPAAVPPAKLDPPEVSAVVPRRRLFNLLDKAPGTIIWLQGPPGAGKTTLAASYAEYRQGRLLWYRFDAADADPAVFFSLFAAAARRRLGRHRPLPAYGPECLGDLPAFARTYFRATLPAGSRDRLTLLVFDDMHVLPEASPTTRVLTALCEALPAGSRCLCLSRRRPPAAWGGLVRSGRLFAPEAQALRFDTAETARLARRHGRAEAERLDELIAVSEGWAAALTLLLRQGAAGSVAGRALGGLAAEAWELLSDRAREHLVATCILETLTPGLACSLTGDPGAADSLRTLAADHFLVSQTDAPDPAWRVHALLRPFLLARAAERLGGEGFADLRRRAAGLVRAEGRLDEAARLYAEAADWPGLRALINDAAADCLNDGHHLQLLDWLSLLPEAVRADPWLRYWEGMARLVSDPPAALECLAEAHRGLGGEAVGRLLAAAGALGAIGLAWDDTSAARPWLAELARLEALRIDLADARVDTAVILGGFSALQFDLGNPLLDAWAQAAERILPRAPPAARGPLAAYLCTYHVWHGDLARCRALLHSLAEATAESQSLFLVTLHIWKAVLGFLSAGHAAAYADVEAARALAGRCGLGFLLPQVYGQEAYTALSAGDLKRAERAIADMTASIRPGRRLDQAFLHHVRSGLLLARGDLAEARQAAERSLALAEATASATPGQLSRLCLAQVLVRQGLWTQAERLLDEVEVFCVTARTPLIRYIARLTRADACLSRGETDAAAAILAEALPEARLNDWINPHPFWQPASMARLCALAMARGIEPDYVARLVRQRHLPAPAEADASWPWPVRIRALGPLQVEVEDRQLDFPVRAQGKPLELLRRLIAQGGQRVPLSVLADALWPEAEGDHALAALKTTVQRLRALIGATALVQREGRMGLDRRAVWLDVWAFEALLRDPSADPGTLERVIALYRGPLLADQDGDAIELPARARLHAAWLTTVERLCQSLIAAGRAPEALQHLRAALAVDPLSEALQRTHLELCLRLDLTIDARRAYLDYERLLARHLGVAPGRGIRSLIEPHLGNKKS